MYSDVVWQNSTKAMEAYTSDEICLLQPSRPAKFFSDAEFSLILELSVETSPLARHFSADKLWDPEYEIQTSYISPNIPDIL